MLSHRKMTSFQGNIKLDNDSMVNKIKTICKDLEVLDDYLKKNNLPPRTRRPITQAIWCFDELSQYLGFEEVESLDETVDSKLVAEPNVQSVNDLDESAVLNPDPRPRLKGTHSSPAMLHEEVDPRLSSKDVRPNRERSEEVDTRLSSKDVRPNQPRVKQSSNHKNIETDDSKARATVVPDSDEPTEQLLCQTCQNKAEKQHQHQQHQQGSKIPVREVKALSERTAQTEKDHLDDIKYLRDAVRGNMRFFMDGNSIKVRPSETKSSKATPAVTSKPIQETKTDLKTKGNRH